MRVAYFDCFSGISGDMSLGALIACGVDPDDLRADLDRLSLPGWRLDVADIERGGIRATDVTVVQTREQTHGRHLSDILAILDGADLPDAVREHARTVFTRLATAEARVHGATIESIHFHEVGAVDAIVDVLGVCCALHRLGIEQLFASPLPMGRGFVQCAHGTIPLPAPAVLELLHGAPIYQADVEGETVTPTGAALLTGLGARFGAMPSMVPAAVGYGAGKKEFGDRPNLLRVVIGEANAPSAPAHEIGVIETNLDDFLPQFYEPLAERLFADGALDVFTSPIQMKKGRPATLLTVLAPLDRVDGLIRRLLRETTTLGVRFTRTARVCAERHWVTVTTAFGDIRIKVAEHGGEITNAAPEYEDVLAAARASGAPLKTVHQAALVAYAQRPPDQAAHHP